MIKGGIKQCCEEICAMMRRWSNRPVHSVADIVDFGTDLAKVCDLANEIDAMLDRKRETPEEKRSTLNREYTDMLKTEALKDRGSPEHLVVLTNAVLHLLDEKNP